MSSDKARKRTTKAFPVIKAYAKAAARYPWLLTLVIVGGILIQVSSVVAPLFMSQFITLLSKSEVQEPAFHALLMLLIFGAATSFIGWIGQRISGRSILYIETSVMRDLSNEAFGYLLRHSHDFFISNFTGTLTRRVNRYAKAFEQVFDIVSMSFFSTFLFTTGVIITLSLKSLALGMALLVWCIVFTWLQILMTKWRQEFRILKAAEDSKATGLLSDAVGNHSTITLFAAVGREIQKFAAASGALRAATVRSWLSDDLVNGVQGLMAIGIQFGLFVGGLFLWQKGVINVGDFVLIQVYMIGLINQIWGVGSSMRRLYDGFADAHEMIEMLEKPHDIQNQPDAGELAVPAGNISFTDVSFAFKNDKPVLENLTLDIAPHQKVAFVGPSGAGKTTITKLLLRLYDVTGGSISVDGTDIRTVQQESLREAISFVPQDPILFHRSLRDNIRYAKEDATDDEVIAAAKKAHCHEFISGLPEGYDTHVGERGVKLSGGERQRVAIARAILKNAPILVLDEATSSLDSESERLIQDALAILMQNKTVIVIAHRLSTIMEMDRIIVMQGGAIVADGTHKELLEQGELYHKLWSIQAGGFIKD